MRKNILKISILVYISILNNEFLFSQNVLITEIMYRPSSLCCEYVEIYNNSGELLNIKNWKIGDLKSEEGIEFISEDFFFPAGNYAVIAEDSSFFDVFTTDVSKIIICDKLPALNNTGDLVILKNSTGKTIDSVFYFKEWGNETGRSIERKTLTGSSNDPLDWALSTDFSGGTPGRQNSIFFVSGNKNVNIELVPDPFSPDNDGFEDELCVKIELPFDRARLNLKIFDRYGRFIKTILNGYEIGQKFSVIWDGKNEDGHYVNTGIYILLLEVLNEKEKFFESYKKTVVVYNK